jgi:hypothetical protein
MEGRSQQKFKSRLRLTLNHIRSSSGKSARKKNSGTGKFRRNAASRAGVNGALTEFNGG